MKMSRTVDVHGPGFLPFERNKEEQTAASGGTKRSVLFRQDK
jgi:hypothetical protein